MCQSVGVVSGGICEGSSGGSGSSAGGGSSGGGSSNGGGNGSGGGSTSQLPLLSQSSLPALLYFTSFSTSVSSSCSSSSLPFSPTPTSSPLIPIHFLSPTSASLFVKWEEWEEERILISFSVHGDNLRLIIKDVGDSKNVYDITDYYFRFIHSAVQLTTLDIIANDNYLVLL